MPVKISPIKPIRVDTFLQELAVINCFQVSIKPGEYLIVADSNDTAGVTAVYNAHDAAKPSQQESAEQSAITDYNNLAAWAKTGTAAEAETYINSQIFNGFTRAQVDSYINTTIVNITTANVAQINAQLNNIRTVFKTVGSAIIATRGLFILVSKLLIYIRDLVIKFRK